MKKIVFPLLCLFLAAGLAAQQLPKKYVLLEHFTNSRCSVCASKNPAFYSLIANYPDDVHHIAYHPPVPYVNCAFYLANPTENAGRAAVYGINGTPRVALNGALAPVSGTLLQPALLVSEIGETSPLSLTVTESGTGAARTVKIKAKTWGTVPSGNYRIFAAVVEKIVNYNSPNGESVHHDVFRKMLPMLDGGAFAAPALGEEIEYTYDYTIAAGWEADQVYVVAFVQNITTGEVLNSGTKFDPAFTSAVSNVPVQTLQLSPNPAYDRVTTRIAGDAVLHAEVFNSAGSPTNTAFYTDQDQVFFTTASLPSGVYFVKIRGDKGVYVGKFLKV